MKRKSLWLLALFAAVLVLALGLHYATVQSDLAMPAVALGEQTVPVDSWQWHTRVFPGVYKAGGTSPGDTVLMVNCDSALVPLTVSEGWNTALTISRDGTALFSGTAAEYNENFRFTENGDYLFSLTLSVEKTPGCPGYGTALYCFGAQVALTPKCTVYGDSGQQGDIFTLTVENIPGDTQPWGACELGPVGFFRVKNGWAALVPAGYARAPGQYAVQVTAGDWQEEKTLTVTARDFDVQYMEIDEETYDNTAGSAAAGAEYTREIWPLYKTTDPTRYWTGAFLQPVTAEISTEYGLTRYVNGKYSERHGGIDFAADGGVPVACPAGGRVVYAGPLQLSGNTVVVEHGGGMKSYFFHMRSLSVAAGQTVHPGDEIGLVGATGYATGDHLHYEVKIGTESVNPWRLFDGTSSVFTLDGQGFLTGEELA